MTASQIERRASKRHQVEVPVNFGRGTGTSRDISFTGIYFTTKDPLEQGEQLHLAFELHYAIPGKPLQMDCQGHVIRVEKIGNFFGVAAKLDRINSVH